MSDRKIYAGTLWWTDAERDLLDLKLAEADGYVDEWRIAQGTTTFRGTPRKTDIPVDRPDIRWFTVPTESVISEHPSLLHDPPKVDLCTLSRSMSQRNVLLDKAEMRPQDIFILNDLDEVLQRQDYPVVIDAAIKHGLVWHSMRHYIGKIDRFGGRHKAFSLAVTGEWWQAHTEISGVVLTVHGLRHIPAAVKCAVAPVIDVRGQHFCWLHADFAEVERKLHEWGHPEFDTPQMLKEMRQGGGRLYTAAGIVPVDDSYPTTILENLSYWDKYRADPDRPSDHVTIKDKA
jgi:hypothetical protein